MQPKSCMLMPLLVGLETHGWSISRLRSSGTLGTTAQAMRESLAITNEFQVRFGIGRGTRSVAHARDEKGGNWKARLMRLFVARALVLWLILLLVPRLCRAFDIEAFFRVHFSKASVLPIAWSGPQDSTRSFYCRLTIKRLAMWAI